MKMRNSREKAPFRHAQGPESFAGQEAQRKEESVLPCFFFEPFEPFCG